MKLRNIRFKKGVSGKDATDIVDWFAARQGWTFTHSTYWNRILLTGFDVSDEIMPLGDDVSL